ncbi:MAG: hypothetical protein AAF705_03410 [Bacteroidota bacterium]
MKTKFFLFLAFTTQMVWAQTQVNFKYNLDTEPVAYPHYWKSTGYSPALMTSNEDYRLYLNMLRASKGQAIEYIRPHYLMSHIDIKNLGKPNQSYDWSELDAILDLLIEADLKLIFEMMTGPHPYFNDWYDRTKLETWHKLCSDMIIHLQERYGKEVTRSWYFEGTNEPDIDHFWTFGPLGYLYYYDATADAIKKVDSELRFGGPGSARGLNTTFESFIQHVYDDFNYYTQKKGVVADFITWHIKDDPHDMMGKEKKMLEFMSKKKFRDNEKLASVPIGNDESDPLAGWGNPYWWRPTPWYAGFVAHTVDMHNQTFTDELNRDYFVLSNDNAFMGDWYRRTHVARFVPGDNAVAQSASSQLGGSWNSDRRDERPKTEAFYLVKKPDFTVMSLLAMQGNQRFKSIESTQDSTAGATVTKNEAGEYFIVTYNKPEVAIHWSLKDTAPSEKDAQRYSAQGKTVKVNLTGIPKGNYQVIQYRIDDDHANPYKVWQDMGSPEDPTTEQIKQLQAKEDPAMIKCVNQDINGNHTITDIYQTAGVTLTYLAKDSGEKPLAVQDLEFNIYNGLNNELMVMLNWNHAQDLHIKSYDVFYSAKEQGKYKKVNTYHVFERGFLQVDGKVGFYKIQAVDHWGRLSDYSTTIEVK